MSRDAAAARSTPKTTPPTANDLRVVYRSIEELQPYKRNARTHSDAQVEQIVESIKRFGWTNPVLIDDAGSIIAGHGRVLAARKLGLDEVPTIELGHLTEQERRAYVIADNKLALNADWDVQLLSLEIEELATGGFDLGLLGFDDAELRKIAAVWNEQQGGSGDKPFDPHGFGVVIECASEAEQAALLEELMSRGMKCRALL